MCRGGRLVRSATLTLSEAKGKGERSCGQICREFWDNVC